MPTHQRALPPSTVRLYRLLRELSPATRARVTNAELAARLGVTSRSVTAGLSKLKAAGLIVIEARRGHPLHDPVARTITPTGNDGEVGR